MFWKGSKMIIAQIWTKQNLEWGNSLTRYKFLIEETNPVCNWYHANMHTQIGIM